MTHGFVPITNRWLVLVAMVTLAATTMVMQVVTFALLWGIGGIYVLLYWGVPTLLFLLRKRARRGDFATGSSVQAAPTLVVIIWYVTASSPPPPLELCVPTAAVTTAPAVSCPPLTLRSRSLCASSGMSW